MAFEIRGTLQLCQQLSFFCSFICPVNMSCPLSAKHRSWSTAGHIQVVFELVCVYQIIIRITWEEFYDTHPKPLTQCY